MALLDDPTSGTPAFTPDVEGTYTLTLTVSDGLYLDVDTVDVITSLPNQAPVVDAGKGQTVPLGLVNLKATASDPDGDTLKMRWGFRALPSGSTLRGYDINTRYRRRASFTPDVPGLYWLKFEAKDGTLKSRDFVAIWVEDPTNTPPVADAGGDTTATVGVPKVLDGTASSDADGDTLSFRWALMSTPETSTLTLAGIQDRFTSTGTLVPDVAGQYQVKLVVMDDASIDRDWIVVTVD